jgi:small redox-active disulfide protein 2
MKTIEILGTGCSKCSKLAEIADEAARAAGVEYKLIKVTDIQKIITYGVMMTPALVVDGEVKAIGKVPSRDQIMQMLKQECK